MNLSKQVRSALDYIKAIDVSEVKEPLEAARAFYEEFIPMAGEEEAVFKIENHQIPSLDQDIAIRIYRPLATVKLPVVVYFHGGWFNAGSIDSHDRPLRKLANLSGAIILSVGYRLAPEHPFPAGLNDGFAALRYVFDHAESLGVDPDRLALAGDSAGGALAATITRLSVKNNLHKVLCQALIYPVTDASLTTASWQEFKEGPVLNYEGAVDAWNLYLPDGENRKNPDASPLHADDFTGIPSTFIIHAEYDPLKDEAILYAEKLKSSDVEVKQSLYKGMIHGFFQMGGIIEDGNKAIEETANFLIQKFNH
ncbi:alpha/beta hydrolase [Flavobacterium sp. FlaQc-48]|uniref:alpha/beta hydrolase n=1 Tax=Flavobacterium sp. FlaQc-48 TaxID=3374181 RepID=UPI0037576BA5